MDKRSDILEAAAVLFAQFSLKKVTVDEIAEKASVSKATIYKYFDSKDEVFVQVVKAESEQLREAVTKAVDEASSVVDKLRAYLLTKITRIHDLVNFYRVTREIWNEYWPYADSARADFIAREKELIKKILEEGNRTGELNIAQTELTAHTIVISLKSMEFSWATETCGVSLEEYVDFLITIIMNGIGRKKIYEK